MHHLSTTISVFHIICVKYLDSRGEWVVSRESGLARFPHLHHTEYGEEDSSDDGQVRPVLLTYTEESLARARVKSEAVASTQLRDENVVWGTKVAATFDALTALLAPLGYTVDSGELI